MIEYLNLEDIAVQRGENSDFLARKFVNSDEFPKWLFNLYM